MPVIATDGASHPCLGSPASPSSKQVKIINEATVSLFTGVQEEHYRGLEILGSLCEGNAIHQSCAGWAGAVQAVTDRLSEYPGRAAWALGCLCAEHEDNVQLAGKAKSADRLVEILQTSQSPEACAYILRALGHTCATLRDDDAGGVDAFDAMVTVMEEHTSAEIIQREGWLALGKLGLHCEPSRKRCVELALMAMRDHPNSDLNHEVSSLALVTMMWAKKDAQRLARGLNAEDVLRTALRAGPWKACTLQSLDCALGTLTGAIAVQAEESCTRIKDVAKRGITYRQLSNLALMVQATLAQWDILDTDPESPTKGSSLSWNTLSLHPLRTYFIKPMTHTLQCSYVEVVAASTSGQIPQWMVTHWWGTPLQTTLRMLKLHSRDRGIAGVCEDMAYWICTFANNQHDLSQISDGDILTSPFAVAMLSSQCMGEVILLDPDATPLSRVWCVFEMSITQRLKNGLLPSSIGRSSYFLDILAQACDGPSNGITMLEDTGSAEGGWNEVAEDDEAHFPLGVARLGAEIDVRRAKATVAEDRARILNFISAGKASPKPPVSNHPRYEELNSFVRRIFLSIELYRLAVERPAGCEEVLLGLLHARANPNLMVRRANTALFAALNADPRMSGAPDSKQLEVVELLINHKASLNCVNSNVHTALDAAKACSPEIQMLVKGHGGKTFESVSTDFEESLNAELRKLMRKAFISKHELDPKVALANISDETRRSILSAAPLLKMYRSLRYNICVRLHSRDSEETIPAHLGHFVQSQLTSAGCSNKMTIKMCEQDAPIAITVDPESFKASRIDNKANITQTVSRLFRQSKSSSTSSLSLSQDLADCLGDMQRAAAKRQTAPALSRSLTCAALEMTASRSSPPEAINGGELSPAAVSAGALSSLSSSSSGASRKFLALRTQNQAEPGSPLSPSRSWNLRPSSQASSRVEHAKSGADISAARSRDASSQGSLIMPDDRPLRAPAKLLMSTSSPSLQPSRSSPQLIARSSLVKRPCVADLFKDRA